MGLLDSIGDAASSVRRTVRDGVSSAVGAARKLRDTVDDARDDVARGASQALDGAAKLGPIAKAATAPARAAIDGMKLVDRAASYAAEGVKAAGRWAWKNKAEVGFWAATTALVLAVPVSGGASAALAGGLMAGRGAAIAARVAKAGHVGLTAVKAAKAGATAVRGARGAVGATKFGAAAARGGGAIHNARVALGATKVGRGMIAAQRPVNMAATTVAGANLADVVVRYSKGTASNKDVALATLGVAPAGILTFKGIAARRAARANAKAAEVATRKLDDVAASAAGAKDEVAAVARGAPAVNAPKTAGAAASAHERAGGTLEKAAELRHRATITARSVDADEAISARTIAKELDVVEQRAATAGAQARAAEDLAPAELTPAATAARQRLERAEDVAARAKRQVQGLAVKQERAERVVDGAERTSDVVGSTALHANIVNNATLAAAEKPSSGWSLTDGSLLRGIAASLLARNNRAALAMPAGGAH